MNNFLKEAFGNKTHITRDELLKYFLSKEPNLKKNTFYWRVYNLKRKGIINEIANGVYSFYAKSNYSIQLSEEAVNVARFISKQFSDVDFCIYESSWVNEFSKHQYSNDFIIVEVEKELMDSVFYKLKEKFKFVFIKPRTEDYERYITDLNSPIVIEQLPIRAPLTRIKEKGIKYFIPKLEKLLVDIFSKSRQYYFLSRSEVETIIIAAFKRYNINRTTMLAYAERRGKKDELMRFLSENGLDK